MSRRTSLSLLLGVLAACDPAPMGKDDSAGDTAPTEDLSTFYLDADGDGFGDAARPVEAAEALSGTVSDATDCDDADAAVHPGADEDCDGVDDDCDGLVDEGLPESVYYADGDGDRWGDEDEMLDACMVPSGYVTLPGDCDDADDAVNPDIVEVCGNGVDDDCSDGDEHCLLEGSVDLADAESVFLGDAPGDYLGASLAGGGDANGDGVPEFLIAETEQHREETTGDEELGGFWLIQAPAAGEQTIDDPAFASIWGEADAELTWKEGSFIDDLDGDGFDEVLAGTWLFLGPIDDHLSVSEADAAMEHPYVSLKLGAANASMGDAQLVISGTGNLYQDGAWGASVGAAFVFDGPITGTTSTELATASIAPSVEHEYGYFGWDLCAGDLDGDGAADLVVGSPAPYPTSYPTFLSGGAAYVLYGPLTGDLRVAEDDGTLADADARIQDSSGVYDVGHAVSCGGDADGDGLPDLLLGAPDLAHEWDGGRGAAALMLSPVDGETRTSAAAGVVLGDEGEEFLGFDVSLDADLDGDGRQDAIVASAGDGDRGETTVFYGGYEGTLSPADADATLTGEAEGDGAAAVAGCPDLDGDGFDELLIGAPGESTAATWAGAAYVVFGGGR